MKELNNYKSCLLGKWPHRYKAFNLNIKENINLKSWLSESGFFDFNINNKGYIVYYHQIVAYFHCGGIHAFKRNMICNSNEIEIHHLNGNTLDNNANNLVYLHRILHVEITTVQRKLCKYLKTFRNNYKGCGFLHKLNNISLWNKQGRLIINVKHFVMYILIRTIKTSSIFFNIKLNIGILKLWLKRTSSNIKGFLPLYHVPIKWVLL